MHEFFFVYTFCKDNQYQFLLSSKEGKEKIFKQTVYIIIILKSLGNYWATLRYFLWYALFWVNNCSSAMKYHSNTCVYWQEFFFLSSDTFKNLEYYKYHKSYFAYDFIKKLLSYLVWYKWKGSVILYIITVI